MRFLFRLLGERYMGAIKGANSKVGPLWSIGIAFRFWNSGRMGLGLLEGAMMKWKNCGPKQNTPAMASCKKSSQFKKQKTSNFLPT